MKKITLSKIENIIFHTINSFLLVLLAFITLYPFWNTIVISLNDAMDTLRGGVTFWPRKFSTFN